jgi:hypothetical protein
MLLKAARQPTREAQVNQIIREVPASPPSSGATPKATKIEKLRAAKTLDMSAGSPKPRWRVERATLIA